MLARDLMTPDPPLVRPQTTLMTAARRMRDFDANILPVLGDTGMVGVLTERDIVLSAIAEGISPMTGCVRDSMSTDVTACDTEDDGVDVAAHMARRHTARAVVVDDTGLPVGIVSIADLLEHDRTREVAREALERIARAAGGRLGT